MLPKRKNKYSIYHQKTWYISQIQWEKKSVTITYQCMLRRKNKLFYILITQFHSSMKNKYVTIVVA